MAYIIDLPIYTDKRGSLTVLDDVQHLLPFQIRRIFYIYEVDDSLRGGHRHKATTQAAICVRGSCTVFNDDGSRKEEFLLNSPGKCLVLGTKDWHQMHHFSQDAILLVLASTSFDPNDYIFEPYPDHENTL
ncbi:sugar 3,4-ketoisomerase [Sediminibacterium ginsengisoli]|uniref:WxcM-like, C-terminal n=1 Tax=Sediminibacterium ginsengisoli TaxID=413434 RepID=A0A1T4RMP7_9BACT|nr:FdtA/QdtA family cupin domain-containing protein [Sediminibacterium ginsengisoli]SKA17239.1 WxcM-like, C-terminal [Sediminibacterium ginsengisoli]